jgi:FMN phosphatase YigB (HAD superfamily)
LLKAIIFDWDNTLLDWSGFSGDWATMARQRLEPVYAYLAGDGQGLPDFDAFVQDINNRSLAAWLSVQSGDLDAPNMYDVVGASLADFGLGAGAVDVEAVLRRYPWGQVPGTRLYPEVRPVLDALRGAGLRLGLITNAFQPMWMRDQELHDLGILACFDCRISAADVGKLKPHPLPFERVLSGLGASAQDAVLVGDSLQADIAGAQAVGLRSVWRQRDGAAIEDGLPAPDATIQTLDGLLPILDGWFPEWRDGR